MAAGNQLQRQFALADAAWSHQQHPDGGHFHEHAVQGDHFRQLVRQVVVQDIDHAVAGGFAGKQRRLRMAADLSDVVGTVATFGDDDADGGVAEQLADGILPRDLAQAGQIFEFGGPQHLQLVGVDQIEMADQGAAGRNLGAGR